MLVYVDNKDISYDKDIINKMKSLITDCNDKVHKVLERSGFYELLGEDNICSNINEAVAKAWESVGKE